MMRSIDYSIKLCLFLICFSNISNNVTISAFSSPPNRIRSYPKYLVQRILRRTTDNTDLPFRSLKKPELQRGSKYGHKNNSTIPQPFEIAAELGVKPTKDASAKEWQTAWKLLKRMLPLLHIFDRCKPPDSSLNLACMWWKALTGNDKTSPVYDNGLSYDILPSGFRLLVSEKLCNFYPRLHHANVELRTAFLDSAILNIIDNDVENGKKIRLICLGAGYDLRSIKLLERKWVNEAYELDLKEVVEGKRKLIGKKRLLRRRPWLLNVNMPKLIASDLNDVEIVRQQLTEIVSMGKVDDYHNIFVFEGVMIYLHDGIPRSLLNVTSDVLINCKTKGSLCFADRLENIPGGDYEIGREELSNNGWIVKEWSPKPGLARHMGSARLIEMKL